MACKFPTQELANIHSDVDSSEDTIIHFIESGDVTLDAVTVKKNTISLICIHQTLQIDGFTSAAVYGECKRSVILLNASSVILSITSTALNIAMFRYH